MRSVFVTISKLFGLVVILTGLFGVFYWYNNRLFLWEARFLWPQVEFDSSKFKAGPAEIRASMVVDLVQNKNILNMSADSVPEILGEETGDYYHSGSNFTYKLTNSGNADWILTLVTGSDGKIQHVFIRRSCCSISKKFINFLILDLMSR